MTDSGKNKLRKGQPVWVTGQYGPRRAAEYVGEAELSGWLGESARVIVVYLGTQNVAAVDVDRVIPRPTEDG